jgi:1-acyl-sn-glycerol-3-phosphate acyltransferase
MMLLRSRLFDLALVIWTLLFAPAIPLLWLSDKEAAIRSLTRLWARGVLFNLRHIVGLDYTETTTTLQSKGPYLIVSNHQSVWETIAFLVIFPDIAVIAKEELLSIPIFGWYLKYSPMIMIDRDAGGSALRKMVEQGRSISRAGRSILVFPEGSRVPPTQAVRFRRGVELLYAALGLPVLPVAVNSGLYWGPRDLYRRPGKITVSHLRLIEPGLAPSKFARDVEEAIDSEVRRLTRRDRLTSGHPGAFNWTESALRNDS